jgi:hypothetical protein
MISEPLPPSSGKENAGLTAAFQQRVGRGEFSHYVSEAVARQLELDLLGELSALLQAEHGPQMA